MCLLRTWKSLFILLTFLATMPWAYSGYEEACGEEVVIPEVEMLETLDQGVYGNCYAHATATIVDAYRLKRKIPNDPMTPETANKNRLSPLQLMALYENKLFTQKDHFKDLNGGGDQWYVFNDILKYFKQCPIELVENDPTKAKEVVKLYKAIADKYYLDFRHAFTEMKISSKFRRGFALDYAKALRCDLHKSGLVDEEFIDFEKILDALTSNTIQEYYVKLFRGRCKGREFYLGDAIPAFNWILYQPNKDFYIEKIAAYLEKNKLPISLNICAYPAMLKPGTKAITHTYPTFEVDEKACGRHGVVIYGKRTFKGKCQLKIRNSWGKKCEPYKAYLAQNKARGGKAICDPETGDIWMDWEPHFYNEITRIGMLDI